MASYSLEPDANQNGARANGSKKKAEKKTEKKTFASKIFASHEFGYRRITVERPLRLSVQFTDERISQLRFASGPLNAAMQKVYELYGQGWTNDLSFPQSTHDADLSFLRRQESILQSDKPTDLTITSYGQLAAVEAEVRALVKADFSSLKEAQIKDLLASKIWLAQKNCSTTLARSKPPSASIGMTTSTPSRQC